MTKSKEQPLKLLINQMLRAYGYGNQLDEVSLIKSWEDVAGKMIAQHTSNIYFTKGKLYITLDSAPLRQELRFLKTSLIERLNLNAGKMIVKELIFK